MTARKPYIGGNWKMNTRQADAVALAEAIAKGGASLCKDVEVVLFPPAPWLSTVAEGLTGSDIGLGGQDVSPHEDGAYTGQISAGMLVNAGCDHVLVGHSERRHGLAETDALLNRKVEAGLKAGLSVLLCIGETLAEHDAGETASVVEAQLRGSLAGVASSAISGLSVAYEPVWAIGTGRTAAPDEAQSVHELVRHVIADMYDASIAGGMRILYGGSMKPDNAAELLSKPDIDGGLIGGASLHADLFLPIVEAALAAQATSS